VAAALPRREIHRTLEGHKTLDFPCLSALVHTLWSLISGAFPRVFRIFAFSNVFSRFPHRLWSVPTLLIGAVVSVAVETGLVPEMYHWVGLLSWPSLILRAGALDVRVLRRLVRSFEMNFVVR
jgi:hypothetical protein